MAQNPQQRTQGGRGGGGQPSRHLTLDLSAPLPDGDLHKVVASAWYKEDNRPKKGVAILFYLDLSDLNHPVLTNEEGQAAATLAELGPGPHTITVKVQGWGSAVSKTVTIEGKKKEPQLKVHDICIQRNEMGKDAAGATRYDVLIQVVDEQGKGIPAVPVRISDPNRKSGIANRKAGPDGTLTYRISITARDYRLTVSANGVSRWEYLFNPE